MTEDLSALLDYQLGQGVAVSTVSDGTLIFLSVTALEKMLEAAKEKGRDKVVLFAQRGKPA